MKRLFFILSFISFLCIDAMSQGSILAFPTAEGFGAYAKGGRGGKVVYVTNLEDASTTAAAPTGSLRWALNQYSGDSLTVLFKVSGVINLVADLRCTRNNLTIAGQTAPGDGICIRGHKVNLGGSTNLVLRHLRFRVGIVVDATTGAVDDDGEGSIDIENGSYIIVDHCTFGWSGEENMTMYDNHYTTVQWSILHEGLYVSGHTKGARSYASQWGGSPATYHHNLLADNNSRSCRFNGANNISGDRYVLIDYVNNVNYNWGSSGACYGGEREVSGGTCNTNFVNNYYKRGRASNSYYYFVAPSKVRSGYTSVGPAKWYLSGNVLVDTLGTTVSSVTDNNWAGVSYSNAGNYTEDSLKSTSAFTIDSKYVVNSTQSAADAYASVLAYAGAFPRDTVDRRIVNETAAGTVSGYGTVAKYMKSGYTDSLTNAYYHVVKGIIDSPDAVGGYPTYVSSTAPTDTDNDGMPDDWETANGLDPADSTDGNKVTTSGYTALEVYLDGLCGETIPLEFASSSIQSSTNNATLNAYFSGSDLYVNSDSDISSVVVYDSLGKKYLEDNSGQTEINATSFPQGVYIVKVLTSSGTTKNFKLVKTK